MKACRFAITFALVMICSSVAWGERLSVSTPFANIRSGYSEALRIKPDFAQARNNLGIVLYGLAVAHAEAGRFAEAIKTASEAIEAATAAGNEKLVREIRGRVALYRQGLP